MRRRRFGMVGLVAIVAVLAVAIAIAKVVIVAKEDLALQECQQEYKTLQAGLDAYMAYNGATSVPAGATADPTNLPSIRGTTQAPYVQQGLGGPGPIPGTWPTRLEWAFAWDSAGRVIAISQIGDGPPVPMGCVVSGS